MNAWELGFLGSDSGGKEDGSRVFFNVLICPCVHVLNLDVGCWEEVGRSLFGKRREIFYTMYMEEAT